MNHNTFQLGLRIYMDDNDTEGEEPYIVDTMIYMSSSVSVHR